MLHQEALRYTTPAGTADFAQSAYPVTSNFYASPEAAIAALNGTNTTAVLIEQAESLDARPFRCLLSVGIAGAANETIDERAFILTPTNMDGVAGVMLERLYDAVWTCSANAIPTAQGGRDTAGSPRHKTPKTVTLTDSGLAESRSGLSLGYSVNDPVVVTVRDSGNHRGIIRLFKLGASNPADGVAPLHARWR